MEEVEMNTYRAKQSACLVHTSLGDFIGIITYPATMSAKAACGQAWGESSFVCELDAWTLANSTRRGGQPVFTANLTSE